MKTYKTKFSNNVGDKTYPIYLTESNGVYDLKCEYEIYAIAWHTIYTESINDLKTGLLKEKL